MAHIMAVRHPLLERRYIILPLPDLKGQQRNAVIQLSYGDFIGVSLSFCFS